MKKLLITGATGNVGTELINALSILKPDLSIYAGVRDLRADQSRFTNDEIEFTHFDFTDTASYRSALDDCDILFLVRPPQIAEVEKYFKPLIAGCIERKVQHIIFLSVQGVEKSKIIPHHKIEKLIVESKIPYTFLRPAYFMQNFSTTLHTDLVEKKMIYLPAGSAKFTLIDVRDIGAVAAYILTDLSLHINKAYELTCHERLTFSEMAKSLSNILGIHIPYKSPDLISFFLTKRQEKTPTMLILVMIMLHYFPRFQKEPEITDCVEKLIHRLPITFEQFILDNKNKLIG